MTEDDLSERDRGHIEGYARALDDMLLMLTGDRRSSKSYDPMTISGNTMHSYAFDLKDGGRHHPLSDYGSVDEICDLMRTQIKFELHESQIKTVKPRMPQPKWVTDYEKMLESEYGPIAGAPIEH